MDKKFAKGFCFSKLFYIFLIVSIIGTIYEDLLNMLIVYRLRHEIVLEYHRGVIYGPFNIVYGFGAVILVLLLGRNKRKNYLTFLYGALLGGIIEYTLSFLQETITGTISWDYSDKLLNINGRTTIPFMLFWGLATLILINKLYPFLSIQIEKIPIKIGKILTIFLVTFMCFDMIISLCAVVRQTLRKNNVPAYTFVGRFLDKHYTDDFLKKYYCNMRIKEK